MDATDDEPVLEVLAANRPHVRPHENAVAVCSTEHELLIAVASSRQLLISSLERSSVVQLLTPSRVDEIRCVAFCRATCLLAAGAGEAVSIYSPADRTTDGSTEARQWQCHSELSHGEAITCIAWPAPQPGQPPALWVAGCTIALWRFSTASGWQRAWSRLQAAPVRHMAASVHGTLLATAGSHDRLVKVWHRAPRAYRGGAVASVAQPALYDFCYLRHPTEVTSLDWRPAERGAPHGLEGDASADAAILLTASTDGMPRLWRMARPPEPEPLRMFLCATLTADSSGAQAERSASTESSAQHVQLVQWLEPNSRPSFSPPWTAAGGEAALHGLGPGSSLSPYMRPPTSPLLTPGMGVPTLRPSLRDRHDYLLALLADGTLVVWLVLGLSIEPRCSPKLMVWATLPQVLPRVNRVLWGASFCNFESLPRPPHPRAGDVGAAVAMAQRAESDQLPSAISMVQHISDDDSTLRLCSVNVERGAAAGERVHQQLLGGQHSTNVITALFPHPSCSLVATCSLPTLAEAGSELLLWESAAFSSCEAPRAQLSAHIAEADDNVAAAGASLREASGAPLTAVSSPSCLLRLPDRYDTLVWLPPRAAGSASFVALNRDGAHLYSREAGGRWVRACSLPARFEPDHLAPAPQVSWACAHSFLAKGETDLMRPGEVNGFALRAGSSQVVIWAATGSELRWLGDISLRQGRPATVALCATPVPINGQTSHGHGATCLLGKLLCGYSDGAVGLWTVSTSGDEGFRAQLHASMLPAVPSSLDCDALSLAVCAGPHVRAAVVIQRAAACELLVLAFESSARRAEVELRCDLARDATLHEGVTPCALTALPGGMHALAVGSGSEVLIFAQRWRRAPADSGTSQQWEQIRRLPVQAPCTSVAWAHSGALILGAGSMMVMWPSLMHHHAELLTPTLLPQWHPSVLFQQLLAEPKRSERILHHLASLPSLASAEPLPMPELLRGQDIAPASPRKSAQATESAAIDDDFFAPKLTSPAALFTVGDEAPAHAPQGTAARLLELLGKEQQRDVHLPGLDAEDTASLARLLRARKVIDSAGAAVDACGSRFLLYALAQTSTTSSSSTVPSAAVAWAMLSDNHATLLEVSNAERGGEKDWRALRALGVGLWLPQGDTLRNAIEAAAKAQFTKRKDPEDCALLYIALGKKKQLQALCKAVRNDKLYTFLSKDFSEPRWRSAALKNAYSLLSKQQFELAAAFFLLGDELASALKLCARQLGDLQLSLVLSRLHTSDNPEILRDTVREELLPDAKASGDSWLWAVAHLLLGEPALALKALGTSGGNAATSGAIVSTCGLRESLFEPCTAAFCAHIAGNPRFHLAMKPLPPQLLLRCSYALERRGCLILAIEALRGGIFDKQSSSGNTFVQDAVLPHKVRGLICRYLAGRAVDLVAAVHRSAPMVDPFVGAVQQSMHRLRDEVEAIAADAAVTVGEVRELAARESDVLVTPNSMLPRLLALGCLQLWESCHAVLESAVHVVASVLATDLPHELSSESCATLASSVPALVAGYKVLLAERALEPSDALRLRVVLIVLRAEYALCCALRDFDQLLSLLQHCGRGAVADGAWKPSAPSERPRWRRHILSNEERYVWSRFHLCALHHLRRGDSSMMASPRQPADSASTAPRVRTPPPLHLTQVAGAVQSRAEEALLCRWMVLLRISSCEAVSQLGDACFPLDPTTTLSSSPSEHTAISAAWALVSGWPESGLSYASTSATAGLLGIWPLESERTKGFRAEPAATQPTDLQLSTPLELFSRRGDYVRAVCVNALNSCQLAVSLARGVQQLELTDASMQSETATEISVQQSSASDFTARCLCAHPKLPLYLAGGDSVVQCWQFGQTIQGQGLHDHLRAQYKLASGGRVASIRISPDCEQFSSLDQGGSLCLWRFHSGSDMPLPFTRLQCHSRRGADLCFVNSSVVLATVGLSHANGGGGNLCLWDVLLPPAQALVASSAAHADGARCVLHCAAESSLVSGGEKGEMVIFDLRQRKVREKWSAHSLAVQAMALADGTSCLSASADTDIKLWSIDAPCAPPADSESASSCAEGQPRGRWPNAHEPHTLLAPLVGTKLGHSGVTALTLLPGRGDGRLSTPLGLITGGADGRVKLWRTAR